MCVQVGFTDLPAMVKLKAIDVDWLLPSRHVEVVAYLIVQWFLGEERCMLTVYTFLNSAFSILIVGQLYDPSRNFVTFQKLACFCSFIRTLACHSSPRQTSVRPRFLISVPTFAGRARQAFNPLGDISFFWYTYFVLLALFYLLWMRSISHERLFCINGYFV